MLFVNVTAGIGILEHAAAASVFTTPTINGYKRFRPYSFAPDRVTWALENRAAFIRVIGGPGDETAHVENRAGEPCAKWSHTNRLDPRPLATTPATQR